MDMTNMNKPQFKQIHPVDLKFASALKEFDEFYVIQQSFAYNELKFEIQCSYYTTYGLIEGILEFNKTQIQFKADTETVISTLLKTTSKQIQNIDQEVINKFSFTIYLEDIYCVNEKDKWIQFCLFGLTGIDLPILDHEDQPSIISVSLLLNHRCSDQVIQIISQLTDTSQISKISSHQIFHLMNYILKLNRYQINKKSFRKILHKYQQHKQFIQMQCLSQIVYYDIISIKKLGGQHKWDIYQQKLHALNKPSSIISQSYFEQIVNNLPQHVIDNPWCQVFNPKYHGNSYQEFLRRTKFIKEHILIIKDNFDNIFGAYVECGWEQQLNYYGSEQSFLFTFKNHGYHQYRASKLNDNFQFCSEEFIIIGGPYEDDQFSIKINNNFTDGELNTSSTFRNELLSNENIVLIKEFEIWGVQDNCELMMRHLRLESYLNMDQQ